MCLYVFKCYVVSLRKRGILLMWEWAVISQVETRKKKILRNLKHGHYYWPISFWVGFNMFVVIDAFIFNFTHRVLGATWYEMAIKFTPTNLLPSSGVFFVLLKDRFIVTSRDDISRYKGNNADTHINFSATKEHKNTSNLTSMYVFCDYRLDFYDKQLLSIFITN